jgi:hypothetical protein
LEASGKIAIRLDREVAEVLEGRGIRPEDVEGVLAYVEETGSFFTEGSGSRCLAYRKAERTTYWVEYEREDDGYRVLTAYSHRMEIVEGLNMPAGDRDERIDWVCARCARPLEWTTVKLIYLDETFAADIPACPSCRRPLVSEKNAVEKMATAEKMLEDK